MIARLARLLPWLSHRGLRAGVLLALAALPVPVLRGLNRVVYSDAYQGFCGPHAPDIPRHACTYDQYMAEFQQGFAGVAAFFAEFAVGSFCLLASVAAWLVLDDHFRRLSKIGASGDSFRNEESSGEPSSHGP